MHNYATGCTVNLLAEKTGADAVSLMTPRDPGLLQLIDVHSIEGMPSLTFTCTTLKVCSWIGIAQAVSYASYAAVDHRHSYPVATCHNEHNVMCILH